MHELIVAVVIWHSGVMQPPAPPLPRRVYSPAEVYETLANSGKSPADQVDALFFAMRGRFASGREHARWRHKYSDGLTPEQLAAVTGEIAFDSDWRDWSSRSLGWGSCGRPWDGPRLASPASDHTRRASWGDSFMPNPLALPPVPWIPPGSTTPLPRLGR